MQAVVEALVGLGFPEKGARTAVDAVIDESAEPMESSALLRNALNRLGKK
mgnify:CR=1 FL=1